MVKKTIIENFKLSDLIPYEKNYQDHKNNLEHIKNSLKDFGYSKVSIGIDENNILLYGHGTLQALKEIGEDTAPFVMQITGMSENQKRAYRIADNESGRAAEMILENLKLEFEEINMDYDLSRYGLDIDSLGLEEKKGFTDEDEVSEVSEENVICKLGDLIELGSHRLICADSTIKENIDRLMNGEKADMVFTDPPYGISYDDKKYKNTEKLGHIGHVNNFGQIKNDNINIQVFIDCILNYFKNTKDIFIWGVLNGNGNVPSGSWIVWDKKTEPMAPLLFGDFDICWSKNKGWKMLRHIWGGTHNKERGETRMHPTQKPIALILDFFNRWGKDLINIVDLFGGSGSTLIACEKTNRKCFMMELDPHYCDVIITRYCNYTGNYDITINGEKINWQDLINGNQAQKTLN